MLHLQTCCHVVAASSIEYVSDTASQYHASTAAAPAPHLPCDDICAGAHTLLSQRVVADVQRFEFGLGQALAHDAQHIQRLVLLCAMGEMW